MDNELIYVYDGVALSPSDFYLKEHKDIYSAITSLRADRKTIDVLTLSDELSKD